MPTPDLGAYRYTETAEGVNYRFFLAQGRVVRRYRTGDEHGSCLGQKHGQTHTVQTSAHSESIVAGCLDINDEPPGGVLRSETSNVPVGCAGQMPHGLDATADQTARHVYRRPARVEPDPPPAGSSLSSFRPGLIARTSRCVPARRRLRE